MSEYRDNPPRFDNSLERRLFGPPVRRKIPIVFEGSAEIKPEESFPQTNTVLKTSGADMPTDTELISLITKGFVKLERTITGIEENH